MSWQKQIEQILEEIKKGIIEWDFGKIKNGFD